MRFTRATLSTIVAATLIDGSPGPEPSDGNCLEVPAGKFDLVARYYLPREEIITSAWTLPKLALEAN